VSTFVVNKEFLPQQIFSVVLTTPRNQSNVWILLEVKKSLDWWRGIFVRSTWSIWHGESDFAKRIGTEKYRQATKITL